MHFLPCWTTWRGKLSKDPKKFRLTYSVPTFLAASTKIITFEDGNVLHLQSPSIVIHEIGSVFSSIFLLPFQAGTSLRLGVAPAHAITTDDPRYIRCRNTFAMPHFVCIIKLPGRCWLKIDIVNNLDLGGVGFIIGGIFSNGSFEYCSHSW